VVRVDGVVVGRGGDRPVRVDMAGPADGFPVLVHAGSPGSRRLYPPAVTCAAEHGFRLISYDRPGYGDTPARAGRVIADAAAEVGAIASELGISKLAVWGASGGAPYALACAALLPDLVVGCCVFSSFAPYGADGLDFTAGWSDAARTEVELFFQEPDAARGHFRVEAAEMFTVLSTPDGWLGRWGSRAGTDDAHSRDVAEHLARVQQDALGHGDEGWWDDWAAVLHPWGFDPTTIGVPVQLWHGLADRAVSPLHGRWLADHVPGVDAHFPDDDDHTDVEANHQADGYSWLRDLLLPGFAVT
jgi:pimeloyl-ACP methyl ester carboxylesterase